MPEGKKDMQGEYSCQFLFIPQEQNQCETHLQLLSPFLNEKKSSGQ